MSNTIDPKCEHCYGSGWVHTRKEQDEHWYDQHPDRSRPSYYAVSEPCPRCNPPIPSRVQEWGEAVLSRFRR